MDYKKMQHTDENVVIFPGAHACGDVMFGEGCSVWFNAVVRADEAPIVLGKNTNIQDNAVLHVNPDIPLLIGDGCTVGHGAILHSCTVGDNTLIGMGAIVLTGAKIGKNCLIGAGSLVTGRADIPDGWMACGNPAKPVRRLSAEEVAGNRSAAEGYVSLREQYR